MESASYQHPLYHWPQPSLNLWCRLIYTIKTIFNHLQASKIHPHISSHHMLFGQFNYNQTPIIPVGTQAIIYKTPNKRQSFSVHGVEGWYTRLTPVHYICYGIFVNKTHKSRVGKTVGFQSYKYKLPAPFAQDCVIIATKDLANTFLLPNMSAPIHQIGNDQHTAPNKSAAF